MIGGLPKIAVSIALVAMIGVIVLMPKDHDQVCPALSIDFFLSDPLIAAPLSDCFRAAPLRAEPMLVHAAHAQRQGDLRMVNAMLTRVEAIDPRHAPARFFQLYTRLEQEDWRGAVTALSRLYIYDRRNRDRYVQTLADLAVFPASEAAVLSELRAQAPWSRNVISALNKRGVEGAALYELNAAHPETQARHVQQLFRDKEHALSFITWLNLLPDGLESAVEWPFDRRFADDPMPPPFNWQLNRREAEFAKDGGVYITYSGRRRSTLVQQVMPLGAGRYELLVSMSGDLQPQQGVLVWQLDCIPAGTSIGRLRAVGEVDAENPRRMRFSVPGEGCEYQRLSLRGEPGEYPDTNRALLHSIQIEQVEDEAAP